MKCFISICIEKWVYNKLKILAFTGISPKSPQKESFTLGKNNLCSIKNVLLSNFSLLLSLNNRDQLANKPGIL